MRLVSGLAAPLAALALWAAPVHAQEAEAVRAARAFFQEAAPPAAGVGQAVGAADLADLAAVHVQEDGRTGLTFVTLVQRHAGVEVFGTEATAAVGRGGQVQAPAPHFERGLALRAGPSGPALSAEAAAGVAADVARRAVRRAEAAAPPRPPLLTDDPALDARAQAAPAVTTSEPRLGYHEDASGALVLAWEVVAQATAGPAVLRRVRVDAQTGAVLADADLVVHDAWPSEAPAPPAAARAVSPVFVSDAGGATQGGVAQGGAGRAGAYRVVPFPFESPDTGGFALVTDPADPVASPLGWHDDGRRTYTVTRGNNAYAYVDADDDNDADPGSAPDGGAALRFDFPFDPDGSAEQNAPAAVTNLFYWNNTAHDVAYHYGFDEGAGNFQVTNPTGAGRGGDAVQAEARDGSGTNNANFGTPPEGQSPRMQMFLWQGGIEFEVTAPGGLAGPYPVAGASFGPQVPFDGTVVPVRGPNGETLGCAGQVVNDVAGRVALVERGTCTFVEKVTTAEAAGAVAVVVYNSAEGGDDLVLMGGDGPEPGIPSAFVGRSAGLAFAQSAAPVVLDVDRLNDRLSSFDAGVVVHEYGHGISNRLVGGPGNVGCLSNGFTSRDNPAANRPGEQMGEGWSDYYALMLTQRDGDSGRQPRGVGTYLRFEVPDGPGIRQAPYSTDFAINDYTYADLIAGATHEPAGARDLSIPHGVGFVWAAMLWDMTWELIDALGFSEDIADASGGAGNQVALNLVTTGLKLTPCTPGFVDARDAILAADEALYDGAHTDLIWRAFARRGLGVDARQGSPEDQNDGRAGFTTPGDLGAVTLSTTSEVKALRPGASETFEVTIQSQRAVAETFAVVTEDLPPWVTVDPVRGTLPAGGEATLRVTVAPSPLDTGDLATTVPVEVGAGTRLRLSVRARTDTGVEGTHDLSPVGPNPARSETRFTLAVAEAQRVEVALYDRLGRRLRAFAADLDADARRPFTVDVGGVASGAYVLQVRGETFAESRTITVVR